MKVLFIGGTGVISSASSELAIKQGIDLYHINRGLSSSTRQIKGVKQITADIHKSDELTKVMQDYHFDAVVDWIAYESADIKRDIEVFSGKCDQFVFISSASAYETPPRNWPVTEETPLCNPIWRYSQNKITCEEILRKAGRDKAFPYTIVRPSHTYDKTMIPLEGGYTQLARMKQGKPAIVHGEGTSLWTLTHHRDFAKGLVGLLGKKQALGEAYHITSDFYYSWDRIFLTFAEEMGVKAELKHVPSKVIASYNSQIGDSLLGDKTHSMVFDNSKIKALVPEFQCDIALEQGVKEIIDWYEEDPARQVVDSELDLIFDRICEENA